jgi:phosphate-selective porin OprO/OprP
MKIRMQHATLAALCALGLAAAPAYAAPEPKTKGGFEIKDGDFSFKFGGRIMVDYSLPSEDVTPMGANLFFRRARLEFSGTMFKDWKYSAEFDMAENAVVAKDLFVTYTGFENQEILIGQFKQPWSLEELSSSKQLAFLERSLMNSAWTTAHRNGLGWRHFGSNHSLTVSAYGKESGVTNALPTPTTPQDEPISYGARFVWAPIRTDDGLLHIGIAMAEEEVETGAGVRLRARPEARVTNGDTRLIDTGNIADATGLSKLGLELAWMSGGLSVQGEYQMVSVDSVTELDPEFSGYYVEARWFLGGEVRPYSMNTAAFSGIKPLSIEGAWELRARLSQVDLEDGCVAAVVALPCVGTNAQAGTEDNISVGVTYYPNANVRWMLEYITADVSSLDPTQEESPSFIQTRFQLSW